MNTKHLFWSSSILVLVNCGGTGQDSGQVSSFNQQFSGTAIDGHLARATIFIDSNNNGTREAWERYAFTDNEGFYSFNPNSGTDYCSPTATPQESEYCLSSNVEHGNIVLRIDGGYDIFTGEPFHGQLSRRIDADELDGSENTLITPLTSLMTHAATPEEEDAILESLSINRSDLDIDYLNTDGNGEVNEELFSTALKVHKVVTVLGDMLTDNYDEIGENFFTPNDASNTVYENLAEQISIANQPIEQILESQPILALVLEDSEDELREIYENREFDLPADLGNPVNLGEFERIVQVSTQINDVVDSLVDTDSELPGEDAAGGASALESLVIKIIEDDNGNNNSIDNAIEFFTDNANTELVETIIDGLGEPTRDINALVNNDFSGSDFDSVEEISNIINLPDDVMPFTGIVNQQMHILDLDLGRAPNNLNDSEIIFYFDGSESEGSFMACIKYIDGANQDGTLGEGNTRGELVDGFWSLLAADANNESYSMLITLTYLETTYQAIIKPAGNETIGDINYELVRFDFDNELTTWHGFGLSDIDSLPSSDEDCRNRLPSRIGL